MRTRKKVSASIFPDIPLPRSRPTSPGTAPSRPRPWIQLPDGKEVTICGIIAGMKIKVTKKSQEKMAILNLEDLSGTVEVVVFPDLYKTSQHLLLTDTPLIVAGTARQERTG